MQRPTKLTKEEPTLHAAADILPDHRPPHAAQTLNIDYQTIIQTSRDRRVQELQQEKKSLLSKQHNINDQPALLNDQFYSHLAKHLNAQKTAFTSIKQMKTLLTTLAPTPKDQNTLALIQPLKEHFDSMALEGIDKTMLNQFLDQQYSEYHESHTKKIKDAKTAVAEHLNNTERAIRQITQEDCAFTKELYNKQFDLTVQTITRDLSSAIKKHNVAHQDIESFYQTLEQYAGSELVEALKRKMITEIGRKDSDLSSTVLTGLCQEYFGDQVKIVPKRKGDAAGCVARTPEGKVHFVKGHYYSHSKPEKFDPIEIFIYHLLQEVGLISEFNILPARELSQPYVAFLATLDVSEPSSVFYCGDDERHQHNALSVLPESPEELIKHDEFIRQNCLGGQIVANFSLTDVWDNSGNYGILQKEDGSLHLKIVDFGIVNMDPGAELMNAQSLTHVPIVDHRDAISPFCKPHTLEHVMNHKKDGVLQLLVAAIPIALESTKTSLASLNISSDKRAAYSERLDAYSAYVQQNLCSSKEKGHSLG